MSWSAVLALFGQTGDEVITNSAGMKTERWCPSEIEQKLASNPAQLCECLKATTSIDMWGLRLIIGALIRKECQYALKVFR